MEKQRVLITGASGFIGTHLLHFLRAQNCRADSFAEDLFDDRSISEWLRNDSVDWVIHLAGLSHVATCRDNPAEAQRVNVDGTANLLRHLAGLSKVPRFLFFSTAQVYAAPDARETQEGVVFDENRAVKPQNEYASSKFRAEQVVCEWAGQNAERRAIIIRLFNHTHKTQAGSFFLPHLYEELKEAAKGQRNAQIPVGNIDLERDMGSIQDLLAGLLRLLKMGSNSTSESVFTLNLCSGSSKNLRRLGEILAAKMGVTVDFVRDSARVREGEPVRITGSCRKFSKLTGWSPSCVTEEDLVRQFLADVDFG